MLNLDFHFLQVVADDDDDMGEWALSNKEKHAQRHLARLAETEVNSNHFHATLVLITCTLPDA